MRVRFRNDGGKSYLRCEAHLAYRAGTDGTKVTFAWSDDKGDRRAEHTFPAAGAGKESAWVVPTGKAVRTQWVEFEPVANR